MATTWNSDAIDIGAAIHKKVLAEGGYMVHLSDRSWFERYDRSTGEFSRRFSDGLMRELASCRSALKVYAAWRRDSLSQNPRGVGTSEAAPDAQPSRDGLPVGVTATQNAGRDMHVSAIDVPVVSDMRIAKKADRIDVVTVAERADGGFSVRFAPHGAKEDGGNEGE